MLYLNLCQPITDKYVQDFEGLFEQYASPEWFQEKIIQDVIKDIDDTEYIGDLRFESSTIGIIGPDDLSGGVKCLISSIYKPALYPCDWLGNNCAKSLMEISKVYDLTYTLNLSMFKFYPEHEIYVEEFNNTILGKDIYNEIHKRGMWDVIMPGLHF